MSPRTRQWDEIAVSDILDNNEPPTDLEISLIQDLISAVNARKAQLNTSAAHSRLDLQRLIVEWDTLDARLSRYTAVLSALRRLPTELLSVIFAFALLVPSENLEVDPPLWTLGQVCSRWRSILRSQPTFWARVDLDFALCGDTTWFRLRTQLHRSNDLPLSINFLCDDADRLTAQEVYLLRLLARHRQRWESVSLYGGYELYDRLARSQIQLPLLRELHVTLKPPNRGNYIFGVFRDAPNLRHAYINMAYPTAPFVVELPFAQLLRYGGSNTWGGHLDTLRATHNLVDCALEISDGSGTFTPPRILLPRLVRLALTTSAFLDCLETPALEELYCTGPNDDLVSFLRRVKLRRLFMHGCNVPFDIAPILDAAPTCLGYWDRNLSAHWWPAFATHDPGQQVDGPRAYNA